MLEISLKYMDKFSISYSNMTHEFTRLNSHSLKLLKTMGKETYLRLKACNLQSVRLVLHTP